MNDGERRAILGGNASRLFPRLQSVLATGDVARQATSDSISSLLTRNLHEVFGENDPARRRAAIDEIFTEDCVFHEPRGVYRGRDEIDRVAGAIKATHPTFDISRLPRPRNWAMAGGSGGSRAVLVRRRRTPGLISSLPGTAGLPPFISFSTSYPERSKRSAHKQAWRQLYWKSP